MVHRTREPPLPPRSELPVDVDLYIVVSIPYSGVYIPPRSELPVDVDSTKYVAGGIVVFDLEQVAYGQG